MSINHEDKQYIDKLRFECGDLLRRTPRYNTDFNLLRWLKGFNYDVDTITPKLRNHLRFHIAAGFENFERQKYKFHPVVQSYYPTGLVGPTGKGNTILFIETAGKVDVPGLLRSVPRTKFMLDKFHDAEYAMQKLHEMEQKTGEQASVVFIQDLEDMAMDYSSLSGIVMGPYKAMLSFFIEHYVELTSKFIVINGPSFLYYIWKLLQPFLPTRIHKKVVILGADWREQLLTFVEPDNLPEHWGGTLTDSFGDPKCQEFINIPASNRIPEELYWHPKPEDPKQDHMDKLEVGAGKLEFIVVEMRSVNEKVKWTFFADSDVTFGVFYNNTKLANGEINSDDLEMIYPEFRQIPGPLDVPECDSVECAKPGFYFLKFGNECAWIRKLTIHYLVQHFGSSGHLLGRVTRS